MKVLRSMVFSSNGFLTWVLFGAKKQAIHKEINFEGEEEGGEMGVGEAGGESPKGNFYWFLEIAFVVVGIIFFFILYKNKKKRKHR